MDQFHITVYTLIQKAMKQLLSVHPQNFLVALHKINYSIAQARNAEQKLLFLLSVTACHIVYSL